jgi:acyl-CoA synthetase (AMP-forming)/AMP-acid ligase II
MDEDNYLFIVDRKKDIIIRGGENISSQEVEAACYGHPLASEVCVFGVADERLGEVPAAIVYSEEGGLTAEALVASLSDKIATFKIPAHVFIHDEPLPKLGTGKIDKVTLRDRYRAELEGQS